MKLACCLPILVWVVLKIAHVSTADDPEVFVTIDAAYTRDEPNGERVTYLFANGKYQEFHNGVNWRKLEPNTDLGLPQSMKAVVLMNNTAVMQFGRRRGQIINLEGGKKSFKYRKGNGPDAVGRKGDNTYYFFGCKMATVNNADNKWVFSNVNTIGLPCKPDAAWKNGDSMVVLKGDQYWVMRKDNSVVGPVPAQAKFPLLRGWKYKPSPTKYM